MSEMDQWEDDGGAIPRERLPRSCTVGPSAVTGERCGEPAVTSFVGSRGERYAECSEHAPRRQAA